MNFIFLYIVIQKIRKDEKVNYSTINAYLFFFS